MKKTDKQNLSSNEELVRRVNIDNSPFHAIGLLEGEDRKWFGVMGKYRITEPVTTFDAVENELKNITWDRIVQVITILQVTEKEIGQEIKDSLKNIEE